MYTGYVFFQAYWGSER